MRRAWVVAAAIALAAVAALFVLFLASSRGRGHTPQDRTRHTLWVLADVLEQYREERGRYPGNDEGLEVLVREGFIGTLPIDPWGHPYQYRFPGSQAGGRFDLWSTGADGRPGGEGEDADITKWDD